MVGTQLYSLSLRQTIAELKRCLHARQDGRNSDLPADDLVMSPSALNPLHVPNDDFSIILCPRNPTKLDGPNQSHSCNTPPRRC